MDINSRSENTSFVWNAGGWYGSQIGSSLWMLIAGMYLLFTDAISGLACLGGFALLNAIGINLWKSRTKLEAYVGIQRQFLAITVIYAAILVTLNCRGVISTQEAFLGIAVPLILMSFFFLRDWTVKRSQGQ